MIVTTFPDHEWKAVVQELSLLKEEVDRLREEMGDMKIHFKQVGNHLGFIFVCGHWQKTKEWGDKGLATYI